MTSFSLEKATDVYKFSEDWTRVRFIGQVVSYYQFWFQVKISRGRLIPVQKLCLDWNAEKETFVRDICPYRKAGLKGQVNYISNGIVRTLQDRMPQILPAHTKYERSPHNLEGSTVYWKEHTSKSWTPVRMLRIPEGLAARLQAVSNRTIRRGYDLAHPEYGRDVLIRFDRKKAPDKMYDLSVGGRTTLTDEELGYLRYPLDIVKAETLEEATDEWGRLERLLPRNTWQIGSTKMFDLMAAVGRMWR